MDKREILKKLESKGFNKSLWNKAGNLMCEYDMIKEGDKIAVGISGGKDSFTLFNLLLRLKMIVNFDFEIIPIHVHYKERDKNCEILENYFKDLDYIIHIEYTNINQIVFEDKQLKNPCSLCSRMRRGVLYRIMQEKNINKLALGHHLDDIIETFLMNVFYQGNKNVMKLKYSSEIYEGIEVIRPMGTVEEKTIIKYANRLNLPIIHSTCTFEKSDISKRYEVKKIINTLSGKKEDIRQTILNALKKDI